MYLGYAGRDVSKYIFIHDFTYPINAELKSMSTNSFCIFLSLLFKTELYLNGVEREQ